MYPAGAFPNDGPRTIRLDKRDITGFESPQQAKGLEGVHLWSNPTLRRRPDHFVQLHLEPHRQRVGNDLLGQFLAGNRRLPWRQLLQRLALLLRGQRMSPREQQPANRVKLVFGNARLGPFVILPGGDDELDFIRALEVRQVFPAIARGFAAAGAFEVHDPPHARVNRGDVMRAAGFEQHREAVVAERLHEWKGILLEQGLAASELDERQTLHRGAGGPAYWQTGGLPHGVSERRRQTVDLRLDVP